MALRSVEPFPSQPSAAHISTAGWPMFGQPLIVTVVPSAVFPLHHAKKSANKALGVAGFFGAFFFFIVSYWSFIFLFLAGSTCFGAPANGREPTRVWVLGCLNGGCFPSLISVVRRH